MVNYTKPELEVTEFEIADVLTISFVTGSGTEDWDAGWY
jgi:hypothetical protein